MNQQVTNFARFYASFNQLPYSGDREEFKKQIVRQYTWERTESLREMTLKEYTACCEGLEKLTGRKDELKKKRSQCLRLMQQLGIDTTDWARINNFCQHPRIAGKPFARITLDELESLSVKLRSIQRKGGIQQKKEMKQPGGITYYIQLGDNMPQS